MGVIKQYPILECDVCAKQVQTTPYSQKYGIYKIVEEELYQGGHGGSSYEEINKKEKLCCSECYSKILNESDTYKKLRNGK